MAVEDAEACEPQDPPSPERREMVFGFARSAVAFWALGVAGCSKYPDLSTPEESTFERPSSLEDLKDGKVLLLFSAEWCRACRHAERRLKGIESLMVADGYKMFEFYEAIGGDDKFRQDIMALADGHSYPFALIIENGKITYVLRHGVDIQRWVEKMEKPSWHTYLTPTPKDIRIP